MLDDKTKLAINALGNGEVIFSWFTPTLVALARKLKISSRARRCSHFECRRLVSIGESYRPSVVRGRFAASDRHFVSCWRCAGRESKTCLT